MKRIALRLACLAGLMGVTPVVGADDLKPLPSFTEPALSPDSQELAFVHAGDIWIVPANGGTAHLLISDPAHESRPLYSPDGKQLAFVSNRTGNGDIYLLTFATGDLVRLTSDDGVEQLDAWSADGKWIYFSSTVADLGASNADLYRVRATGGTPMPVSDERYTNEFHAAPSPDGKALAMSAGASSRDWWRNGHSNWNEAHVWVRRERDKSGAAYEELTQPGARELWPMWSADGKTLYCVSDRDGQPQNIIAYDMTAPQAKAVAGAKSNLSTSAVEAKPTRTQIAEAEAAAATAADKVTIARELAAKNFREGTGRSLAEVVAARAKDLEAVRAGSDTKAKLLAASSYNSARDAYDAMEKEAVENDRLLREANQRHAAAAKTVQDLKALGADVKPGDGAKGKAAAKVVRQSRALTAFKDGRVLWPSISKDGKTIVFERDFGIWRLPTAGGTPYEIKITLRGAANAPIVENLNFTGGFRDLVVSPDGKKLAFSVRGEIFAVSARDGGRATRVTTTAAPEGQLDWSPDSQKLVYVSDRGGTKGNGKPPGSVQNIYLFDFGTQTEIPLTSASAIDSTPRFAPNGNAIVFRRNGTELRMLELPSRNERTLVGGLAAALPPFDNSASPYVFSPRGKWLAYIDTGNRGFDNVYVISTQDKNAKPTQVTFFANTGSNSVSWSGDGRSLMFGTGMRTEDYQLARVDLVPRPPNFSEDQFRGLFKEEMKTQRPGQPQPGGPQSPPTERRSPERSPITDTPKVDPLEDAPSTRPATRPAEPGQETPADKPADKPTETKPAETKPADAPTTRPSSRPTTAPVNPQAFPTLERYDLTDIRRRISLLQVGLDVDSQTVSPDGKWCAFIGSADGKQNVYAYPLDSTTGSSVRQLTSTTGSKGWLRFAPDSRELYFLEGGQIRAVGVDTRSVREVPVQAPMEVDFSQEKMEVARQAWQYLRLNFYDPKMHGVDWDAVWTRVAPRIAGAKTPDEMRRILSLMVGELNASHTGVSGGRLGGGGNVGRLGVQFDRKAYENDGVLKVSAVLADGPAQQAGIKPGDTILSVDGFAVDGDVDMHRLLDRKIGRRVVLGVQSTGSDDARDVPVRPVDIATEKTLLYRTWLEDNRKHVAKVSNGRLGYVHIADMGASALARLNADLDAEAATREGVVVDIRANTGGFASPYVLDVLSRRGYLTISRRGATDSPGRIYVGQRALDLPTVLVTNRQSISDAENFTEGYRALKIGKVVGEPTAGGVIFTSDVTLLDGTSVRIPFSKVTNRQGQSLEGEGRPVDVTVRRPLGQSAAGKDSQLDAAVRTLLMQIDKGKAAEKK